MSKKSASENARVELNIAIFGRIFHLRNKKTIKKKTEKEKAFRSMKIFPSIYCPGMCFPLLNGCKELVESFLTFLIGG